MNERIDFHFDLQLQASVRERPAWVARIYDATLMTPGQPNGWGISMDVLGRSVALWRNASIFVDHPGVFDLPSVDRFVGVIDSPRFEQGAMRGELHIFNLQQAEKAIERFDLITSMREAGVTPPRLGLSAVLSVDWDLEDGQRTIREITKVWSVDEVFEPAAGGEVTRILNQLQGSNDMSNEQNQPGATAAPVTVTAATPAPSNPSAPVAPGSTGSEELTLALQRARREQDEAVQRAQCGQLLEMRLATANLPEGIGNLVRSHFTSLDGQVRIFSPGELDSEIGRAREAAAALAAPASVQGMGHPVASDRRPIVNAMWSDLDRLQAAYDRMMGLPIASDMQDVPRLTGIREMYHLLTGDREMRGVYQPGRVQFANANTTTMAEFTRNVINKAVYATWANLQDYRWWQKVVAVRSFESIQQVSWVTYGGFGDLPTIGEGASYTELTWDDSRETSNWLKKGGYLGLTLEMIDRDDTEKWRAVPVGMAIAALRTLSNEVATIFTQASGTGPTLSDGLALFHTTHANLLTTALAAAQWDVVVQAVFKQTELNSGKRLGIRPSLVLVPIELRKTAVNLFVSAQEPGGNLNDVNVAGRDQMFRDDNVVVVPEWTDANDWAAAIDPRIAPGLGVGFRFGETPEVFIAADPNSYLMFHNDTLPVKVRYFYTVGVIDYRPLHKSNVA